MKTLTDLLGERGITDDPKTLFGGMINRPPSFIPESKWDRDGIYSPLSLLDNYNSTRDSPEWNTDRLQSGSFSNSGDGNFGRYFAKMPFREITEELGEGISLMATTRGFVVIRENPTGKGGSFFSYSRPPGDSEGIMEEITELYAHPSSAPRLRMRGFRIGNQPRVTVFIDDGNNNPISIEGDYLFGRVIPYSISGEGHQPIKIRSTPSLSLHQRFDEIVDPTQRAYTQAAFTLGNQVASDLKVSEAYYRFRAVMLDSLINSISDINQSEMNAVLAEKQKFEQEKRPEYNRRFITALQASLDKRVAAERRVADEQYSKTPESRLLSVATDPSLPNEGLLRDLVAKIKF